MNKTLCGLLLLSCAGSAFAQTENNAVDVYAMQQSIAVRNVPGSLDGPGAGVRIRLGESIPMVTAAYEYSIPDGTSAGVNVESKNRDLRAGLGLRFLLDTNLSVWGRAEYVSINSTLTMPAVPASTSSKATGYAGHAGLGFKQNAFGLSAEFGRIKVEDNKGYEASVSAHYQPDVVGGFLEFRRMFLNLNPGGGDQATQDIRLGIRVAF